MIRNGVVSVALLVAGLISTGAMSASYQYNDAAPYHWETAATDVVWSRRNTQYPVDDDQATVDMGFSFPFGGGVYSQVRILSNGVLQFGSSTNLHREHENSALAARRADRSIQVYWDDLNPASGGSVRYSMHGTAPHRYFVVSWEDLPNYDYTGVYRLQVILYEDGEFKLQYGNGNATGDSATIGVQVSASDYTQYSYNRSGAVDGQTAIVFYQDRPHFALGVQSTANLCRSDTVNVSVSRHTADHTLDTGYSGTVVLSSAEARGRWTLVSGSGAFVDIGGGQARYAFVAADRGEAVFQFSYTEPVITGFHVNDGAAFEHHAEDPFLTFEYGIADNAADGFAGGSYSGSDGSLAWRTDWIEINESDGAASGDIRVVSVGGEPALQLQHNDGGGEGVYREVDLSGQPGGTLAMLSFGFLRSGLDDSRDYVAVSVSADGGRSWIELDRFVGPGSDASFQPVRYDISRYMSANTRIRFLTSSDLGPSDRVTIDDVNISLRMPTCGIDHYGISHGGVGVSCEASSIRVSAHDSTHGAAEPGAGVVLTLVASDPTTGAVASDASWSYTGSGAFVNLGGGRASYTFAAAETEVELWLSRPAGGTVNVDLRDSGGASETPGEDADLAFLDSALRFYADGTADAIGAQIAGKASNVAPGDQVLTLRAVETDSETGACRSRLTGRQSIEFAYECVSPSSCALADGMAVAGTAVPGNPAGNVSSYHGVMLDFDAAGYARIPIRYDDAGSLNLHARAVLPATDQHPEAIVQGAGNTFAVAPAGLCVAATAAAAACVSGDASCGVLGRAGLGFDLDVRAVAWQSVGEQDADFCSGNATTPNFALSGIGLSAQLVAPTGGVTGSLGDASVDITAADAGSATLLQTYSEVGVFRITASPPPYQGVALAASQSVNIGRQVPDRFVLSAGLLGEGCGAFTYMDQPALSIDYTLEAQDAGGDRTMNYRDGFAKAGVSMVAENANDGQDLGGRISVTAGTWSAGAMAVNAADAVFGRAVAVDGPFDSLAIGLRVADNDGDRTLLLAVDMNATDNQNCQLNGNCNAVSLGQTAVRYGRLNLLNAHGSELVDLPLPMRVETFQGAGVGFDLSSGDNCTTVTSLAINELDAADDLLPSETCVWDDTNVSGAGCTGAGPPASQFLATAANGVFNIHLMAPGNGNTGVVGVAVDGPDWLRFDWLGVGQSEADARATFGIFGRRSGVIYQREVR